MHGTKAYSQFKTLIYEEELDRIAGWVEEYPNLETGGDLFGFWTHSGAPVVQYVLGPGSDSRHNPASFYQDREHLIKAGEILRNKHGLQHIGEWHSHHQMGLAEPSPGDSNTVIRALQRYNFPRFLLCIANIRPNSGMGKKWNVNVGCFLYSSHESNYQAGAWVVLPRESPIRSNVKGQKELNPKNSRTSKSWTVDETTLEEESLVTTEPIEVSEKLWYSTQQGQAILKEIFDKIQKKFQQCEMSRTNEHRFYLTFECQNKHGYVDSWRADFPEDFPQSSPKLKVNNETFAVQDWHGNPPHFEQVEDCINRYYNRR